MGPTELLPLLVSFIKKKKKKKKKNKQLEDVVAQAQTATVDGEAFLDSLRCLYFLLKQEIPHTTNFTPLRELAILLGNQTLPRLREAKNATYTSEMSIQEMIGAIGENLEERLLRSVHESPFFSIEATDISVVKQLGLVVCFINMTSVVVETHFLKLIDLTSTPHATANVVTAAVVDYIEGQGLSLDKLAGGACDGAAIMLGERSGVATRLREMVPTLIMTHCAAHRLALAACNTAHKFPWFSKFEKTLNQLYTHFSHSAVRSATLAAMQKVLDAPQLKLQRPTDTRWLSLENAVHAVRLCLDALVLALDNEACEGDATALGLATHLKKPWFVVTLYFMSDVLSILGSLSTAFQTKDLNLLSLEPLLNQHINALETLKGDVFKGGYLLELKVSASHASKLAEVDLPNFTRKAQEYLSALLENLRNRFPQAHLLSLLGLLDPRNVEKATPSLVIELGTTMGMDGHKLWNEFLAFAPLHPLLPLSPYNML